MLRGSAPPPARSHFACGIAISEIAIQRYLLARIASLVGGSIFFYSFLFLSFSSFSLISLIFIDSYRARRGKLIRVLSATSPSSPSPPHREKKQRRRNKFTSFHQSCLVHVTQHFSKLEKNVHLRQIRDLSCRYYAHCYTLHSYIMVPLLFHLCPPAPILRKSLSIHFLSSFLLSTFSLSLSLSSLSFSSLLLFLSISLSTYSPSF